MPVANPDPLTYGAYKILRLNPATVVDIGMGFGTWGYLVRAMTDAARDRYFGWTVRLDGVEIWEPYITPLQRAVYSNIHIGDALEVLPKLPNYDLAIAGDVLEHFSKERGAELLKLINEHSKHSLVVLPSKPSGQKALYGNVYETHVARWTLEELAPYGNAFLLNPKVLVVER